MKNFRLFFLLGIGFLFGFQSLSALEQSDKEKQAQQVKQAVEDKQFTIEVDRALPMGARSINLTSSYTLVIKGDSVSSYLPYFGRAYTASYGGDNGLIFGAVLTNYTQTLDKKGNASVHFRTKTDNDSYEFYVNIFTNGSTTINVTPVNKQSISYYGQMTFPVDKEQADTE